MHKQLEDQYGADKDVVFMFIQTVFEGSSVNTYDNGLSDLDLFGLKGVYAFDPGKSGVRPATMNMFNTGGTPYTIIINKAGEVVEADFTRVEFQLRPIIETALAAL